MPEEVREVLTDDLSAAQMVSLWEICQKEFRVGCTVRFGGRYTATPKGFRNIFHTPDRNAGEIHLDQGFLNRAFTAAVWLFQTVHLSAIRVILKQI